MSREDDDLKALWKEQETKVEIAVDDVMREATAFRRKIRWRNALEYLAGVFVVVFFAGFALFGQAHWVMRAGAIAILLGTGVVLTYLYAKGQAPEPPLPTVPTRQLVAWHRAELVRQRDLIRAVPKWYVGPFLPGTILFFVGARLSRPEGSWLAFAKTILVCCAIMAFVVWANRRAARKLDDQIAAVDRLEEP